MENDTLNEQIPIRVYDGKNWHDLKAKAGAVLRDVLLAHGLSPYSPITAKLNCGGRGLCATCGVLFLEGSPKAAHWHDRLAKHYGYLRLSCQIKITEPLQVVLDTNKVLWGRRVKKQEIGPLLP